MSEAISCDVLPQVNQDKSKQRRGCDSEVHLCLPNTDFTLVSKHYTQPNETFDINFPKYF